MYNNQKLKQGEFMTGGGARQGAGRPKGTGRYGAPTKALRIPENLLQDVLRFVKAKAYALPLYASSVKAGFPSPAEDYAETTLDLNQHLIAHPHATFFVRASGHSMIQAGIFDQDLLIVDRSLEPTNGKIVIAVINGELTVKRFKKTAEGYFLAAENPEFPDIAISASDTVHIWGVVCHVIHSV
jgi:DNA polymerase V